MHRLAFARWNDFHALSDSLRMSAMPWCHAVLSHVTTILVLQYAIPMYRVRVIPLARFDVNMYTISYFDAAPYLDPQ